MLGQLTVYTGFHRDYGPLLADERDRRTEWEKREPDYKRFLVVDEPALFLHPHHQRLLARALAHAANRGLIVILGTHSDYVIREISNLIRLGEMGDEGIALARKMGLRETYLLRAQTVCVYNVSGIPGVVTGMVDSPEVDKDGFTVESIDDVIEAQNTMSSNISFGMCEDE